MGLDVYFEMRRLCGGVSALFATERFFSRVNQHVGLEMSSLFGRVIALCASKRLLTTMNQHVSFQIARPIACVVALVATVGLLSVIQGLYGNFYKVICLHFHAFLQRSDIVRGCRITEGKITLIIGNPLKVKVLWRKIVEYV